MFQLEESIIKEGIGQTPQDGDQVYFFFCSKNQEGLICGSQFSATKCIIGQNWLIPELEQAIKTMKQGQRSIFKVYHNPSTREFYNEHEIEVIKFGRKADRPWHTEGDQLYNRALKLKAEGNNYIKEQNYLEAQCIYQEALNYIKNDYAQAETELSQQIRSNLTLTYLKNKDFENCSKIATQVLDYNPNNAKLLHRRAVALIQLGDFDTARQDLNRAINIDPQSAEIKAELDQLQNKEKNLKKKQQDIAKRMLFEE